MKISLKTLVVFSLFFISCKKESANVAAAVPTNSTTLDAVKGSLSQSAPAIANNPARLLTKQADTPNSIMRTVKYTAVQVPMVKGRNPAHGQLGHRCDIAVGAPLNAPALETNAVSVPQSAKPLAVSSPTVATPELLKAPVPVVTAAGMNPPHGQGGHRCDVTVGAPLPK